MADDNTDAYDPDTHTVGDVRDHLKGLDNADEVARIQAAEAAGQNRKGIVEWTDKPTTGKGDDGYTRVPVEDPYPAGQDAAWGHGGLNEDEKGTEEPVNIGA